MGSISVIGAGAWGTALAQATSHINERVTLWVHNPNMVEEINALHENKVYLNGIPLNKNIEATSKLEDALKNNIVLMVTPAQYMRPVLEDMKPLLHENHVLVLCSKGIEKETFLLMSEVAQEIVPNIRVAVLTGPNFAHDIAQGKPAATTLACEDEELAETLQKAIASAYFRPYMTDDIIGAQVAGALKNVIAIACGIAKGLNMGNSARASLVTRGLSEISRLGVAMGAHQETFLGLCGVGDMMLTCSSEESRNFSLGVALGEGKSLNEIMSNRKSVTEGVHTAKSAIKLAEKYKVELPICLAVHKCINEGLSLDEVLQEMLNRPIGKE